MNTGINLMIILQSILAILVMVGILVLLYWLIENPVLKDEEMRRILNDTRSMRAEALSQASSLARQESERLYR
ncbi:MAG: hypothetical protein PVI04_09795 [Anaerolineales bacterium]|jgi:hypothetical protein